MSLGLRSKSALMGLISTLGARDFSSAVSGFCQVVVGPAREASRFFLAASAYGRRCVGLRTNTEISRRTREKPLVPRVPDQRL